MVELQWLEKPITGFERYIGKHVPDKVLQYRFAINGIWPDWRDVPTVREEG